MTREDGNPMTGSDFDWMISNHAVWVWKAPVEASVSGVSPLQLSPFFASIFPPFPQKCLILRLDRNKSCGRDRYLVMSIDGAWCQYRKFVGSQLRSTTYRIKKAECYKVPMDASPSLPHHMSSARFNTDDEDDTSLPPASPPQIPTAPPTPTPQLS